MKQIFKEQAKEYLNKMIAAGMLENITVGHLYNWYKETKKSNDFIKHTHLTSGCFKNTLIFYTFDYVIKFDKVYEFSNKELKHNGCCSEYKIYQDIIADKMERFFPETDFLTEIDGYKFYIQERVEADEYAIESDVFNYVRSEFDCDEDAEEYVSSGDVREEDILYSIMDCNEAETLMAWLNAHNINDIHTGNVGYLNGRGVVFDFAGY